ncbi:SseB family protein [Streptomyces sp. NPDC000410]|uniref:SseB family protein n=1 Tax=Streptomyces sp. NPDC000410 TaxID=3154254 RepID=UPI0033188B9E
MSDNGDDISRPGTPSKLADLAELTAPRATRDSEDATAPTPIASPPEDEPTVTRRSFARLLGEFRRTAVLVPVDPYGSLWTADQGGIRWICAFSHEEALARFAHARGDAQREWTYQTVLGARLLDVMVPTLGMPAGVALDAGGEDGVLFPPVEGVVPDAAVVELGGAR